jgi:WD repeat-containing protein 42A
MYDPGTRLASGSDDTFVAIWDWAANDCVLNFDSGHSLNVFQVKFLPLRGDTHLVTAARDGQVRLAELSETGACKQTRRLVRHADSVHKVSLDPSNPHVLLSCGEDAVVYEIDVRDAQAASR